MTHSPHSDRNPDQSHDREGSRLATSAVAPRGGGRRARFRLRAEGVMRRVGRELLASRASWLALGHLVAFVAVYRAAFELRFGFEVPPRHAEQFWLSLPWLLAVKMFVFYISGHYHGWWHYVTLADVVALVRACIVSLVALAVIDHFVWGYQVPRGVLILDFVLAIVVLGAFRASWRMFREQFRPIFRRNGYRWALLVGADHSTAMLAHQIQSHHQLRYRVRGFVATEEGQTGSRLGQIPILGSLEDLREIAAAYRATEVLVTAGTLHGKHLRQLMEICDEVGLNLKIIRPVEDRLSGDHRVPVRNIEINDLLRRDPVELDTQIIGKLLEGRAVMVTGAGGSIGSEICRQVLDYHPQTLILVGRGENRVFKIERELQDLDPSALLHACIGDVTDRDRMRQLFEEYRPEVVFHAAAHKHVPLMEANPGEAIKTNVCGTKCLADLADEYGALRFVFISTDKAVHPASVMGVTKHVAERYVLALSGESSTRFTVVRFGNVLGSDGSVVPLFQEQIRRGGPITVTDAEMTRFFMTIPEASQLVLQAAAMGSGGEIFVLEMGEPVRIVDLARDLIRLSGLPEDAIEITFTGVRRGEKLFEELYFDDEQTLPTSHPKLRAAYPRPYGLPEVDLAISELMKLAHASEEDIRRKLHQIVPEYVSPSVTIGELEDRLPSETHSMKPQAG